MKIKLPIVLFVCLCISLTVRGQDSEPLFERFNAIAASAFPKGTTSYEMFYVPTDYSSDLASYLGLVLTEAKKEKARWVIASEDETALREVLTEVFDNAKKSRKVRTEIVIVSPIESDESLTDAAMKVGASLEYFALDLEGE